MALVFSFSQLGGVVLVEEVLCSEDHHGNEESDDEAEDGPDTEDGRDETGCSSDDPELADSDCDHADDTCDSASGTHSADPVEVALDVGFRDVYLIGMC